jgi:hypothetical protein
MAYVAALSLAVVLMIFPAGCCIIDASMLFVNGFAVAAYGYALGRFASSERGARAGVACLVLGLCHPAWVSLFPYLAGAFGLSHARPFSASAATALDVTLEHVILHVGTGAAFAIALAICLRSWLPIALISTACAAVTCFLLLVQPWLLAVSPLGGLWPSGLSLPAGILHLAIATSLWLVLSGDARTIVEARLHVQQSTAG